METIYLSLRAQVALGTFFMKSPVGKNVNMFYQNMNFLKSQTEKVSRLDYIPRRKNATKTKYLRVHFRQSMQLLNDGQMSELWFISS